MIMKKIYLYILVCVLVGYSCDDMNDFEQGILKGYVLDAVTGEGLADVDVVLEPVVAANGSVTSKSDGHFNLSRLVAGTYSVNVRKNGASIIDNAQDEITITDGCVLKKQYKLTPRILMLIMTRMILRNLWFISRHEEIKGISLIIIL